MQLLILLKTMKRMKKKNLQLNSIICSIDPKLQSLISIAMQKIFYKQQKSWMKLIFQLVKSNRHKKRSWESEEMLAELWRDNFLFLNFCKTFFKNYNFGFHKIIYIQQCLRQQKNLLMTIWFYKSRIVIILSPHKYWSEQISFKGSIFSL